MNQTYSKQFIPNHRYLNQNIVQKIIDKFLTQKKMSKIELAETLEIKISQLEKLPTDKQIYHKLISKINLPLIDLYCKTSWNEYRRCQALTKDIKIQ